MPDPRDNLTYPNRREEDQNVEMKPVVVGPGAYASPDPNTEAGRLLPLNEHPLADTLSADYGKDHLDAGASAGGEEEASDYNDLTVEELKDEARDREIDGFSSMNKAELVKALKKSDKES